MAVEPHGEPRMPRLHTIAALFIAATLAPLTAAQGPTPADHVLTSESPTTADMFGYSVAAGQNFVALGVPESDLASLDGGAVNLITQDPMTGEPVNQFTVAPAGLSSSAQMGVRIAADGDTIAVTAPQQLDGGDQVGAVFVYRIGPSSATLEAMIQPSGLVTSDMFAIDVDIKGDTLLVGAHGADGGKGGVWVFNRTGSSWSSGTLLTNPTGATGDMLGARVKFDRYDENRFITSAAGAGTFPGMDQGEVLLYEFNASVWSHVSTITACDFPGGCLGATVQYLGNELAFEQDTIVIAEWTANSDTGAVHVFEDDGGWTRTQTLTGAGSATIGRFGSALALDDDMLVVGAAWSDVTFINQGSGYIFRRQFDDSWAQIAELVGSGGIASALGTSAAIVDNGAVLGAPTTTLPEYSANIAHGVVEYWDWSLGTPGCESDSTMDGVTDADDLLLLLTDWTLCPSMPGDCPGDVDGDGDVDVHDLVTLLTGWGSCF